MEHLTTDLMAYLANELAPAERARVEAHLAACADCRDQRDTSRALLEALRASVPTPPEMHWGRWRAELRGRLEARAPWRRWLLRPVPALVATGLAASLIAVVWLGQEREAPRTADLAPVEEVVLGDQLDFLEDMDVIDQLDRLASHGEG
ncbi:MAG TPA: zf-HC2 domain-containing protein [Methylomirabilota bacterium]|jgi:anti-sigma factor RsiW